MSETTASEPTETEPVLSMRERMRAAHREILRRVFLGETLDVVARAVGLTHGSVKFIVRSPLFQAALAELQTEADAKVVDTASRMRMERDLIQAAEEGIPIARSAMKTAANPMVQAKIAFGFMDRVGLGPTRKLETNGDSYREIIERLDEMEKHSRPGEHVEAEVTLRLSRDRRENGEGAHDADRAGVSPAVEPNMRTSVEFLRQALGGGG